jgi:hypothetical protein
MFTFKALYIHLQLSLQSDSWCRKIVNYIYKRNILVCLFVINQECFRNFVSQFPGEGKNSMNARILDPVMKLLLSGKHKFNLSKKWSSSQSPCVQCCRGGGRVRGQQQDVRKRGDAERAENTDESAGGHADVQRSDGQARRRPAALVIGAGGWRQLGSDRRLQAQGYRRKGHPLPDSVQRHDQHVLRVSGHSAGPGQALAAIAAARARAAAAA